MRDKAQWSKINIPIRKFSYRRFAVSYNKPALIQTCSKSSFDNNFAVYESYIVLGSANHIHRLQKLSNNFRIGFLILDHCEGLYLRKDVKSGQIVSLFNGVRCQSSRNQMIGQPNYDYRIKLNGEIDIDIPLNCIDLNQYCATLGHKANHSFTPNCK